MHRRLPQGVSHSKSIPPHIWRKIRRLGMIISIVASAAKVVSIVAERQHHQVQQRCSAAQSREALSELESPAACVTPPLTEQ